MAQQLSLLVFRRQSSPMRVICLIIGGLFISMFFYWIGIQYQKDFDRMVVGLANQGGHVRNGKLSIVYFYGFRKESQAKKFIELAGKSSSTSLKYTGGRFRCGVERTVNPRALEVKSHRAWLSLLAFRHGGSFNGTSFEM